MNLHYLFSKIGPLVVLVSGSNHLLELDSELLWILDLPSNFLVMILNLPSNILVKILNTLFSNVLMPTHSLLWLVLNTLGPLTTMVLMLMVAFLLTTFLGLLTTFST